MKLNEKTLEIHEPSGVRERWMAEDGKKRGRARKRSKQVKG